MSAAPAESAAFVAWRDQMEAAGRAIPVPPCPAWCGLPVGHRFTVGDGEDSDAGGGWREHQTAIGAGVAVSQAERVHPDGTVTAGPLLVLMDQPDRDFEEMAAERAAEVGAALLRAAQIAMAEDQR